MAVDVPIYCELSGAAGRYRSYHRLVGPFHFIGSGLQAD